MDTKNEGNKAAKDPVRKISSRSGQAAAKIKGLVVWQEKFNLPRETIAKMIQVSSRTILRWETKGVMPKNSEEKKRIEAVREIIDLGGKVYGAEGLHEFLSTPQPVFDGHTPQQLMSIGEYSRVLGALAADYEVIGF